MGGLPVLADLPACPPTASCQLSNVSLTVQSLDCVQLSFHESLPNRVQETTVVDTLVAPPSSAPAAVNRSGSIDSDSGLHLRGILKQRSTSGM